MENKENTEEIRVKDPELKINYVTIIWFIIGFIISWLNMVLINNAPSNIEVIAYLTIIFTTILPAVIIGLKDRYWAYAYLLGFSIAGIPYMIMIDPFIGGYTSATSFFIFIILWLIFWKTWRSLSSISVS
ncbi:MAG: hypothetical protein ACFFA8_08545 [Promethearchaeota archaeon]